MRISVFGSGYVGLVTACCLAELGSHVLCVDVDAERVARLRAGHVPFYEPGLGELLERNLAAHRLAFSTVVEDEYASSDVYFIAVGTPGKSDGRADVSAVHAAARTIAEHAKAPAVIAVKSTVPVGTGDDVERTIAPHAKVELRVASTPEFLKEGAALDDFFRPDRVVVGANDPQAEAALRGLFRPLQLSGERLIVTDRRSAELCKYASNAMLATRISFMNELARLCDRVGADVSAIRRAMGTDHRIGPQFLYAGPGYGGSCFPKDVLALAGLARDVDVELSVVEATNRANARQRDYVVELLDELLPEGLADATVAVWGLAFKPETDDVRESPAAPVVQHALSRGARVTAHDPRAAANFARAYGADIRFFENEYDALDGADVLVVMTEWRHFRVPDFDDMARRMRARRILDTRNVWTTFKLNEHGFAYRGIGTIAGRPRAYGR